MAMTWLWEVLQKWVFPKPTSLYRGVNVARCDTDKQLITYNMSQKIRALHGGHKILSPVSLTLKEKMLIWLKIVQ